jgi:hypothetical protein
MSLTLDKCNGIILFINLICIKIMTILTNAEVTDWLNNEYAIRGTLVEVTVNVGGSDITRYLSTFPYTTGSVDTPANTCYDSIVTKGLSYTEALDFSGAGSLSIGDIELINHDGEYDDWLNDVWVNKTIKAYVGDVTWPRNKFIQIFDGVVAGIDSKNSRTLNIKIRDKLQRLNTPISELNYSDVYPYPDSTNLTPAYNPADVNSIVPDVALPVTFGEVHNVTPILIDPGNLVYLLHYGPISGVIEVRDNGIPLNSGGTAYTVNTTLGTLKMLYRPMGQLTVSLQGDNAGGYRNTVASVIKRLVTGYGKVVPNPSTGTPTTRSGTIIPGSSPPIGYPVVTPSPDRFVDGTDIDTANFSAFDATNTQPIGFYAPSKENLLSTCQSLAYSVGASLTTTRLGKLKLLKLVSPPVGTPFIIDTSMYKYDSVQISSITEVVGAIKLGFNKNWTVEQNLQTDIPPDHRRMFAEDWSTVSVFDADTISKYKLTGLPFKQDTELQVQSDAAVEANRRLNLWKTPHPIYKISGFTPLLDLQLGDPVQLVCPRYNLTGATGVGLGTVVYLQPNWSTGTVEVGVFI